MFDLMTIKWAHFVLFFFSKIARKSFGRNIEEETLKGMLSHKRTPGI